MNGSQRYLIGVSILLLILAAAFVGFQQLFSSFAVYDDEGYVLLTLRMFSAGRPLYDDIYTQYGPAYFVLNSWLHEATGWTITNDVARWKTLGSWLITATLSATFVGRITRRWEWSVLAGVAVFFHLDRLGLEPGHPQDFCLPLMAGVLLLTTFIRGHRGDWWGFVAISALLGIAATTKLNTGLFTGLAISLAVLACTPPSFARRGLLVMLALGAMALPLVLLKGHILSWRGLQLPSVLIAGIIGLMFTVQRLPRDKTSDLLSLRSLVGIWGVAGLTALSFMLIAWSRGTSLNGLYWGMLGQHGEFTRFYYSQPPLPTFAVFIAVVGAVVLYRRSGLTILAADSANKPLFFKAIFGSVCSALLLLLFVVYLVESFKTLRHGLDDRGLSGVLLALVVPFAGWLIVSQPKAEHDQFHFARWCLAWNVVLQPLTAIPVPGTQLAIGAWPALVALFLVVAEKSKSASQNLCGTGFQPVNHELETHATFNISSRLRSSPTFTLLMVMAFATLSCRGWVNWERRRSFEPLLLPGTAGMQLPAKEVKELRTVVAALQANSDTFVTLPNGYLSLYLWTGLEPPNGFNAPMWALQLTDSQQHAVIAALERAAQPRLVLYAERPLVLREGAPLPPYLQSHFTVRELAGPIEIWKKAEAFHPEANVASQ